MTFWIGLGAVLAGAIWLVACSGGSSQTESVPAGDLSNKTVRIVFDLPGDDIGGAESQEILQAIEDEVRGRKVATIVGSGFGMGRMELLLKYQGPGSAADLRGIIARIYPKARYRLEIRN